MAKRQRKNRQPSAAHPSQVANPVLSVRVSPRHHDWLRAQARRTGQTVGAVLAGAIKALHDKAHDADPHDCPGASCRRIYTSVALAPG